MTAPWPGDAESLVAAQRALASRPGEAWVTATTTPRLAALFTCFPCGGVGAGAAGDPGWVGVALVQGRALLHATAVEGRAAAAYVPGLLALREGPLLWTALQALPEPPEVVLVNASGRDHPRRAGLALHLGALAALPSLGVTDRPLLATGPGPVDRAGACAPLQLDDEEVARWMRTRAGARPLVVHPGWRVDLDRACQLVLAHVDARRGRTPWPLRVARQHAREARARSSAR